MQIEPIATISSNAREGLLEIWKMTMQQRVSQELQQRISGREHNKALTPAVVLQISDTARLWVDKNEN